MTEVINVDVPPNKAYRILMDNFSIDPDIKVSYSKPSLIRVKKGSLLKPSWSFDVNVSVHSENEKTRLEFDFDFSASYMASFLVFIIGLIFLTAFSLSLGRTPIVPIISFLIGAIFVALTIPLHIQKQEKKFVERVADFFKDTGVKVQ